MNRFYLPFRHSSRQGTVQLLSVQFHSSLDIIGLFRQINLLSSPVGIAWYAQNKSLFIQSLQKPCYCWIFQIQMPLHIDLIHFFFVGVEQIIQYCALRRSDPYILQALRQILFINIVDLFDFKPQWMFRNFHAASLPERSFFPSILADDTADFVNAIHLL